MNAGVSRCSSLIVSRALCASALSCWNISQGSVATHLRRGWIFINNFIAQFQQTDFSDHSVSFAALNMSLSLAEKRIPHAAAINRHISQN